MPAKPDDLWKLKWDYLFNHSPESIIILDEDHTILEANETTLKLLGKSREEVVGKKCYHVFHNTDSPPEGCPFEEMKMKKWKPCANEMETIIGDFIVEVFPMEIPGEGRRILHFARDITVIKEIGMKMLEALERHAAFLDTLVNLDLLILREKDLDNVLRGAVKIIAENENFNAAWILLKEDSMLTTKSMYGANWKFEERYPVEDFLREEDLWTRRMGDESYIFLPLRLEERFLGLIILSKLGDEVIERENEKVLKIIADNLAIAVYDRRLERIRSMAYRELEKNIESFAMLVDGIRNPLAVIMGIAEGMVEDESTKRKIMEQIEKIENITSKIDERWEKSEHLRKFLRDL